MSLKRNAARVRLRGATGRTADHLQHILDELDDEQLTERLKGFSAMLTDLPDGDTTTMRPTVETPAEVIECELAIRQRERAAERR